jgi:hypothetical protein
MPEYNDAQDPDRKPQKKQSEKMKVSSTKGDAIDKGRTITGSKPDTININPVLEKVFQKTAEIYDRVQEDINRKNTFLRDKGTTSLTKIYKHDTPGQNVNNDFAFRFVDPQHDKEAITRAGQPRKKMDLVPRMDPNRDRKKDSDFFRQQSIVKRRVDESETDENFSEAFGKSRTQGKGYKSPWDKIEKVRPGIGKRIDAAVTGIRQATGGEGIVGHLSGTKKVNEDVAVNSSGGSVRGLGYVSGSGDNDSSDPYLDANIANADTRDNIISGHIQSHFNMHITGYSPSRISSNPVSDDDRELDKSSQLTDTKKLSVNGISDKVRASVSTNEETIISELTKKFMNNFVARMISAHPDTLKMTAKGQDIRRKKALDLAMDKLKPFSAIHKPHVLATEENLDEISNELIGKVNKKRAFENRPSKTKVAADTLERAVDKVRGVKRAKKYVYPKVFEDATTEKDPLKHLEDRLNKAGDVSHNAIDKIMREVAKDYNMDVHDLHDKWVNKYKMTPDQYCKEDINEDLRKWFKDKWVRMDTKGNIKGDCAREPGEGKPKCLPLAKARAMDKDDRAAAVRRKRREDPVADRSGKGEKPVFVRTEATSWAQQAAIAIAMKKAGKLPKKKNEEVEHLEEKNVPSSPELWARAKTLAKQKFDVYPSAYANGWAAKWYKSKGGKWRAE